VTVTTDAPGETEATQEVEVVPAETEAAHVAGRRRRWRRLAIAGVTVAVLAILVVVGFQGPLGHVWYQARQQNLAADLNAKRPKVAKGQALGIIQIPKINLNLIVVEGDGPTELRGGPGHRTGTPVPGQAGNSLIFGHRSGWGAPLSGLAQLQPNDHVDIKVRAQTAPVQFTVVSVARVRPNDVRLLAPSDDHRVTLITGTGARFSDERLVVSAVSGPVGKLQPPGRHLRATSGYASDLLNATVAISLVLVAASILSMRALRSRHRPVVAAVVVTPLALGALLALLLELDLVLLPPLH
jgi:sortase A